MCAAEDELAVIRQRISESEHALAAERRHHQATIDRLTAANAQIEALRADQKPAMHREDEFEPQIIGPTTDRQQRHG